MGFHRAYSDFLAAKIISDQPTGFDPGDTLPSYLFDHQRDIIRWALRRGRAAIFAGTGLGKTLMELIWARAVAHHTGKPVLLLAPIAVSHQHEREAGEFGVSARVVWTAGQEVEIGITNYQKLDQFDLSVFGGVALDESSILKSTTGHYRTRLIEACASIPFRLAATATPAPNDFVELGNHAEFLGVMTQSDMLATFFTHDSSETQKWRLKGHAEIEFWKWMASWAVMLRKPSDLGYSDDGYDLPPLHQHNHVLNASIEAAWQNGMLFPVPARSLGERLSARRATIGDRVAKAVEITPPDRNFVWWCNLNDESEAIAKAIPGAVEVRGSDNDDSKERKLKDFSDGKIRVLVTKPTICGFGMNWQHCADTGFVGLNDSFEQVYQSIRRFWRFGQKSPVNSHFISSELEGNVIANLKRKEADADRMAAAMVRCMADLSAASIRGSARTRLDYNPTQPVLLPDFLEQFV